MSKRWWENAPKVACRRCGEPTYSRASVPLHRRCRPRAAPRDGVSWTERQRRAQAVQRHREAYGPLCPGWRRPAHVVDERVNPLSADHIGSVYATGDEAGELQVLCRSCNSSKREQSGSATTPLPADHGHAEGSAYPGPSRAWSVAYRPSRTC